MGIDVERQGVRDVIISVVGQALFFWSQSMNRGTLKPAMGRISTQFTMEPYFVSGPCPDTRDPWGLLFLLCAERSRPGFPLYCEIALLVTTAIEGQVQFIAEQQLRGDPHLYLSVQCSASDLVTHRCRC